MIHVKQPEVSMPEEKKRKGKRKAEENLIHVMVKQDDQNEKEEEEEGLDVFQNNKGNTFKIWNILVIFCYTVKNFHETKNNY